MLKPRNMLFKEGDYEDRIYIILYGTLIIHTNITLGTVTTGGSLGEEAFIDPYYQYRYQ